jgi:hypothetical protein
MGSREICLLLQKHLHDKGMKKAFFILFTFVFAAPTAFAQDGENNLKNFRFGLKAAPSINWYRPDGKKVTSDGAKLGFNYGLMLEFRLNNVASFATGIEGNHIGGKLAFSDSATYLVHEDAIISPDDTAGKGATVSQYKLNSRTYRGVYVNIPLTLKLKTKEIGYMTYYGVFGGDLSFRTGTKVDDKNTTIRVASGTTFDPNKIDNAKDMNLFRVGLNVGAGAEYNVSGSTSLVFGLNYQRGFLSSTKSDSDYLRRGKNSTAKYPQKAYQDGIQIMVGVMF